MTLNSKVYDRLKWAALVLLPAVAAAYFSLSALWPLPSPNEVVGTIVVIETFLGVLLGISNAKYNSTHPSPPMVGYLTQTGVDPISTIPDLELNLTQFPTDFLGKDEVRLKINKTDDFQNDVLDPE